MVVPEDEFEAKIYEDIKNQRHSHSHSPLSSPKIYNDGLILLSTLMHRDGKERESHVVECAVIKSSFHNCDDGSTSTIEL